MNRILIAGLLTLGIQGTVLAQAPMSLGLRGGPVTGLYPPQATAVATDPVPGMYLSNGVATVAGPSSGTYPSQALINVADPGCCRPTCTSCLKTVCAPSVITKKVVTPMYSSVCEPLCYPKWSLASLWHSCCGTCPDCEHPRTKRYLVVRSCVQERPVVVCKPVIAEPCCPSR